jgi:5-oxoprolinase (ATP-hydrolysing)
VHTHITNTRIGDVELLERRYPVLIHRFGLREGSGGVGRYVGGVGCVRELEVLEEGGMQVSILSERRTRRPYGMEGGGEGEMGRNTWVKMRREEDGDLEEFEEEQEKKKQEGERKGMGKDDRKPLEPRLINIGGKATVWMGKVHLFFVFTPYVAHQPG